MRINPAGESSDRRGSGEALAAYCLCEAFSGRLGKEVVTVMYILIALE